MRMNELSQESISRRLSRIEQRAQPTYCITAPDTSLVKSKKVSFSKYSACRVYKTDPYYEDNKSYTSADQKMFQKDAAYDASRIKHLVTSCSVPTGLALRQLMKQGLLSRQEILGIEHLVSINAKNVLRVRRAYIDLVLGAQKRMRLKNEKTVDDEMLAAVAVAKSAGMIEKARLRAALAA
ncbi:hypothetical protein ACHAW6_013118 [Cyclotella cf. meneghiniana]